MSTTPMNTVVVMHRGTPVVFPLDRAECSLSEGEFDAEFYTAPAIDAEPDEEEEHLFSDTIHLGIDRALVDAVSFADLATVEIHVEEGWDTDEVSKEDNIFRWYQFEHQAVDHSTLRLKKREDGLVEVLWTGTVWDLLEPASMPSTTLTLRALLNDNGELCPTERTDG